jgi:mono/diheme cytochrome c family protein
MDALDQFFTSATQLPDSLADTDLKSYDSAALAQWGVISYVPTYPLWSDDAGKMRYVRVPRGQSIAFDKKTQKFTIPANTRFYKTFLKQVIDASGNKAWKKIETRLIVARPDSVDASGTIVQNAIFGTYVWDEAESHADLLKDPYRNGEPFADRLASYITDEPKATAILATKPPNPEYALEVENPGLVRHYAIPGSDRCKQCHMGSPSQAFVLGFTPLEVATVAPGKSGVIEPASGDELTQLQRLIDFGVISGMTSPADVVPLENTQLPRTPRNPQELTAQAYMVGNCAHCHNPRGFPSTKAPELKPVLNFLPGSDGGIFQFPLTKTSPLRGRSDQQNVLIPYVTPSMRDYPEDGGLYPGYITPKWVTCSEDETDGWCVMPKQTIEFIDAPWRSLIYRNVDTPFDYVDDYTIFPHMPMNTPGYDCRVPRIMGDWMISIPATRVLPSIDENAVPTSGANVTVDNSPQPYLEVLPTDPAYPAAVAAAAQRLATYHAGRRYNFCPDTSDISDPAVISGAQLIPRDLPIFDKEDPTKLIMPQEGVPDRANWVVTDVTDPPNLPGVDWSPRRVDWATALVAHQVVTSSTDPDAVPHLTSVIAKLQTITLTDDVRAFLTKEVPFGLWDTTQSGCNFNGIPTAGSFQGDDKPLWMNVVPPSPSAPVYMQSPGGAVFTNICINCHGPQADAKGLLADEISIMTGGDARVANFRTGLFGLPASPGSNRQEVFSPPAVVAGTGTPDDYGARYMAWMALGGTDKQIPKNLLSIVATTPVLGQRRGRAPQGSPNMLDLAQQLCEDVLPASPNVSRATLDNLIFRYGTLDLSRDVTDLIGKNGDAENWLRLCSLNNRQVVRALAPWVTSWSLVSDPGKLAVTAINLYWGDNYPATAPVLDYRGRVTTGLAADNLYPMCVLRPSDPTEASLADAFLAANPINGSMIPYCPTQILKDQLQTSMVQSGGLSSSIVYTDAVDWAVRGAINAGLGVFLYVDGISKGTIIPKPAYNQCNQLTSTGTN